MPKITRYDVDTTFEPGDVMLKDGMYGTKQITADNVSKYIIETYASSSLGGSARTVKEAIDLAVGTGIDLDALTQAEVDALFS